MSAIDHIDQAVLSDYFHKEMDGQRLVTLLFTTYSFDPGFFEQEILRVFFEQAFSQAKAVRLAQLEDALRELQVRPALYYDPSALVLTEGSAVLDIARHPVRLDACFHPKLVCALVEELTEPGSKAARKLIVACQSANLTRAGWWSNLESSHIEVIGEGESSAIVEGLTGFLNWLARKSPGYSADETGAGKRPASRSDAAGEILRFLAKSPDRQRWPRNPMPTRFLFTPMARGGSDMAGMLAKAAHGELTGMNLEIVSPYFDDAESSEPLIRLIEEFSPKEVRIHLPCNPDGTARVSQQLHAAVRGLDSRSCRVVWGSLPVELLRAGPAGNAPPREVHAKIYRFFSSNPKREVWVTGSLNLTRQAFQAGGNMECVFLTEVPMAGKPRPAFLVKTDDAAPTSFEPLSDPATTPGGIITRFALRFDWTTESAHAFWDGADPPLLHLSASGIELGSINLLEGNRWQPLEPSISKEIRERLAAGSLFTVRDDQGNSGEIIAQEEGMTHKPSQVLSLTAADILRYWAMLTPEQRSAFLDLRLNSLLLEDSTENELPRELLQHEDSLFDRAAGIFQAFRCLELAIRDSMAKRRTGQAVARLFGKKHDSLGPLLDRIENPEPPVMDEVERYLVVLCARQCLSGLKATHPELWDNYKRDGKMLNRRIEKLKQALRSQLSGDGIDAEFLDWFDNEFQRREHAYGEN